MEPTKSPNWKGKSSSKPPFLASTLISRVYYTRLYTVCGWANQIGVSARCESSRCLRESKSRDLRGKNFDGWKHMRHKHIPSIRFGWQFNHKSHGIKVNRTTLSKSSGCTSWSLIFVIIFKKKHWCSISSVNIGPHVNLWSDANKHSATHLPLDWFDRMYLLRYVLFA